MTDEELNEIEARADVATAGPWEYGTAICCPDMGWVASFKREVCPAIDGAKYTHSLDALDAEFIAASRSDIPALIAEVRKLREWARQARAALEACECGAPGILALVNKALESAPL